MKKKIIVTAGIMIVCAVCFVFVWNFLGMKYMGKEIASQYSPKIAIENELEEPAVYLPDEYPFYGRYAFIGETYGDDDPTPKLSVVDDRMVYRRYFDCQGKTYYLYYSNAINYYDVTYPDIYDENGEKAARLRENPEGCFVLGNFLYYAYGKDYYNVRVFTLGFLTGHDVFAYCNYKDYQYARLNLDTMINENISKEEFEARYNAALYIGTPKPLPDMDR